MRFGNRISGTATWVCKEVMIRAVPVTLAEAKVHSESAAVHKDTKSGETGCT